MSGKFPSLLRVYFDLVLHLFTEHLLWARPAEELRLLGYHPCPHITQSGVGGGMIWETTSNNVRYRQSAKRLQGVAVQGKRKDFCQGSIWEGTTETMTCE